MVPGYVLPYFFAGEAGPDRAVIDASLPKIREALDALEAGADGGPWLVGETPTAADLFVGPLLAALNLFPEGKAMLAKHPKLSGLNNGLSGLEAFTSTAPRG